MNGKHIALGFLSLAVALAVTFGLLVGSVRGQYGNPYVPTNEYGTPDMSQIELTLTGHYSECLLCVNIPGLGEHGIALSYDIYADNYGNTWVVPTPFTLVYTAIFPEAMPAAMAMRNDAWTYGSLPMGWLEQAGVLDRLGIEVGGVGVDGSQGVWNALVDYARSWPDHWGFMIQLGLALGEAEENGLIPFELWQISWIYLDDPFDPTDDDVGGTPTPGPTRTPRPTATRLPTPTPRPTRVPMPTPIECPPESISQQPPIAQVLELYPPNPVVKGQGGQGLDVTFLAVSFPVIHRRWVREPEYICTWWDVETYGAPVLNNGRGCCPEDQRLPNGGCRMDTSDCWWVLNGWRCVEYVEIIPDPILAAYLRAEANLRPGSRRWIETDLAQKYPGARVREPHLSARASGEPVITADGRCLVEAVAHFDFADPGYYDISVHAQTAGTQYTPPRSIDYVYPTPQPVYLIDTILLR